MGKLGSVFCHFCKKDISVSVISEEWIMESLHPCIFRCKCPYCREWIRIEIKFMPFRNPIMEDEEEARRFDDGTAD